VVDILKLNIDAYMAYYLVKTYRLSTHALC